MFTRKCLLLLNEIIAVWSRRLDIDIHCFIFEPSKVALHDGCRIKYYLGLTPELLQNIYKHFCRSMFQLLLLPLFVANQLVSIDALHYCKFLSNEGELIELLQTILFNLKQNICKILKDCITLDVDDSAQFLSSRFHWYENTSR